MKIADIDINNYPDSEKIYVEGSLFPEIRVGMRQVIQHPTVKTFV